MYDSLLSIIIPTFNSEDTIRRVIDSVIKQTYQNWEIWIIDGCSTDNTINVIKEYSNVYQQINYISEPDSGIYDAINKGIALSKGEWLYFTGSDDMICDGCVLQNVYDTIKRNPGVDIIYGRAHMGFLTKNIRKGTDLLYYCPCHQTMFYKKSVFDKVGKFLTKYKVSADWHHTLMWYSSTEIKYTYIDCCIAVYATNGYSSYTKDLSFSKDLNDNILAYLRRLHKKYLKEFEESNRFFLEKLWPFLFKEAEIGYYYAKTTCKVLLQTIRIA